MAQMPNILDYNLLDKLGSGSYSTVFRAQLKATKEVFAIKRIEKKSLTQHGINNLLEEIRLLKTLKHKHIVEMKDFMWDDKNIYIIMELCNAGDLSTYIKRHGSLPEGTCKYFLTQLAMGMKYLRDNNVSHFDLKPSNLLLTKKPSVQLKIADFGFAQHLNLGEANSTIKGSPLYMAPEILIQNSYDPSADLWSIGVILYECLFGKAPYSSRTLDELLMKIKKAKKIELPTNIRISSDCKDLLLRLLVHDPNKRINFIDFFNHSFLDMKHYAHTEDGFLKASQVLSKAIEADNKSNFVESYHLYCEALQYFVPMIIEESDPTKKQVLKERAVCYMKRAEEIKRLITEALQQCQSSSIVAGCSSSTSNTQFRMGSSCYQELYNLCASSPQIQNGLEIGHKAELYTQENKLNVALDNYKSALGILVPLLQNEPKGHRRDLLHHKILEWMKEAESIKSILSIRDIDNIPSGTPTYQNCVLQ